MNKIVNHIAQQTGLTPPEAWWLLEHVCAQSKQQLLLGYQLTSQQQEVLHDAIDQITQHHKPLAYIIGWVPFLNLKIQVQPPILIPRVETEAWVAQLIEQLKPHARNIHNILDIATGSGCIGLALAQQFPNAHILATDINAQALALAQRNAQLNNLTNISFLQSDLFDNITQHQKFDLIISNPPYINPTDRPTLPAQVLNWEDAQALFAKNQGLELIDKILDQAANFLRFQPTLPIQLIIEMDQSHKEIIEQTQKYHQTWHIAPTQDQFGRWRTIWCTRRTK